MNFSTHCVECKICVMASTTLDADELVSALEDNAEVEVFHVSDNHSDHRWMLDEEEKHHLLSRMTMG
jgi:hypothetical protein